MRTLSVKHRTVDRRCIYQPENIHQSRSLSQRRQTSCCGIFINSGTKRIQQKSESRTTQRETTQHLHEKLQEQMVENQVRIHKALCCQSANPGYDSEETGIDLFQSVVVVVSLLKAGRSS